MWKVVLRFLPLAHELLVIASKTIVVKDGYLVNLDGSRGKFIGTKSSSLQEKVIDTMFEKLTPNTWSKLSIINETELRSLDLHGDYTADSSLNLPSLLRLRLNGSITIEPGISTTKRFDALVVLNGSSFSAVLGGKYNASGSNGFSAISLVSSSRCSVKGARGVADTDVINVNRGELNEVVKNDLGPGKGRCIWALETKRAMVYENKLHDCLGHSLDFDAYTSDSVAYHNTVTGSLREGIFVEETASNNVIVGNTLTNNPNGIGVYSNAVGPVKGNTFIGNIVSGNGAGISAGGYGHDPKKHSEQNVFVGNKITRNSAGSNIHHGDTQGDVWIDNFNSDGWTHDPQNNSAVAVFEPGLLLSADRETQVRKYRVIV